MIISISGKVVRTKIVSFVVEFGEVRGDLLKALVVFSSLVMVVSWYY